MRLPKKKHEYLLSWLKRRIGFYPADRHPVFHVFMQRIIDRFAKTSDLSKFTVGELAWVFNNRVNSGLLFRPWIGKKGILVFIEKELNSRGLTRTPLYFEFPVCWIEDLDRIKEEIKK